MLEFPLAVTYWHKNTNIINRRQLYSAQAVCLEEAVCCRLCWRLCCRLSCATDCDHNMTECMSAARLEIVRENTLMRTPASATSMARVNGRRRIQKEEKVQQTPTTPQLTSLERDGTRYRVQESVVGSPAEQTQTSIFVLACVQSILSYVSSPCVHNYVMSIAEPFSFDFACRW